MAATSATTISHLRSAKPRNSPAIAFASWAPSKPAERFGDLPIGAVAPNRRHFDDRYRPVGCGRGRQPGMLLYGLHRPPRRGCRFGARWAARHALAEAAAQALAAANVSASAERLAEVNRGNDLAFKPVVRCPRLANLTSGPTPWLGPASMAARVPEPGGATRQYPATRQAGARTGTIGRQRHARGITCIRSLVRASSGAQGAGDGASRAPPEAFDLVEPRLAKRTKLSVQREIAILLGPRREMPARLRVTDPVIAHPLRPPIKHQSVQPRALDHRGVEVQQHPARRQRVMYCPVQRGLGLEIMDMVKRQGSDNRVRRRQRIQKTCLLNRDPIPKNRPGYTCVREQAEKRESRSGKATGVCTSSKGALLRAVSSQRAGYPVTGGSLRADDPGRR